ncbi:monoacylglycerol lipase-like [Fagus crenata]
MSALCSFRVWRSLMVLINTFVLLLLVPFQRRRRIPSTRDEKIEEGGTQHQHHQKKVVRVLARMVLMRHEVVCGCVIGGGCLWSGVHGGYGGAMEECS